MIKRKVKKREEHFWNYQYYCDRCGKEVSFENNTLHKIYEQCTSNRRKKVCELCDKCYVAMIRGIKRGKEQKE